MLPGPIIIKKCPDCSGLIKEDTTWSGNTFGAKIWTDGKKDTLMFIEQSWLAKCPHCDFLLWTDELQVVGEMERPKLSDLEWSDETNELILVKSKDEIKYEGATPYETPSFREYLSKINEGVVNKEKESYLRICAWHKGNDKRRYDKEKEDMRDEEIENLMSLDKIFSCSDNDTRILRAEIKRELCLFDDALVILDEYFDNEYFFIVSRIKELAERNYRFVSKVTSTR